MSTHQPTMLREGATGCPFAGLSARTTDDLSRRRSAPPPPESGDGPRGSKPHNSKPNNSKQGPEKGKRNQGRALVRTVLTSVFVLFMLAAAHLFMVVINAAEHHYAAPEPTAGMSARVFSDRPMTEEIEGALAKAEHPADRAVLEDALVRAEAGETVELHTLPVTRFLVYVTLALNLLGGLLLWVTSRLKSDAAQSIVGIFAGNLLWTGGIEYGLTLASRSLGIGKTVGVIDGQLVAIYGEYVLLKHTWGILVIVMAYLLFLESSRCPIFLWWRKIVPTMRGAIATGRIDNYGPRSAFQYATTVWAFYLLLLWAYDEAVFGVYSLTTKAILFGSVAGSIYTVWRLHQYNGWGTALRYAVGAMIIVWTPIEIFAKWGVLNEPWLLFEPQAFVLFFGGLALGTWALWRAAKRKKALALQTKADDERVTDLPVRARDDDDEVAVAQAVA